MKHTEIKKALSTVALTALAVGGMSWAGPASAQSNLSNNQSKVKLAFSGFINKAVLFADDGETSRTLVIDNPASLSTRFNLTADAPVTADVSFGGQIEMEYASNNGTVVTLQGNGDFNQAQTTWAERKGEVWITSKRFGKVSLGQGSQATDAIIEYDLSGTAIAGNYADTALIGNSMVFTNSANGAASGPTVGTVMDSVNGGNLDRIRYDTPTFAGFSLATAFVSGGGYDAALLYSGKVGSFDIAAGAGYYNMNSISTTNDYRLSGSLSVLHSSGINATVAAGKIAWKTGITRSDGEFWYGKLGYIAKIFGVGPTSFGVDYAKYEDIAQAGDEAKQYSVAAVQSFADIGAEMYVLGKNYSLDRTGSVNYDDIRLVMTGMKIAF